MRAHAGKDVRKENMNSLLGEVKTCIATMEIRGMVPQEAGNSYTTTGYILKGLYI